MADASSQTKADDKLSRTIFMLTFIGAVGFISGVFLFVV